MVTRELLGYIEAQQTRGVSRDAIELALLRDGWTMLDVKDALTMATSFHLSNLPKKLLVPTNPEAEDLVVRTHHGAVGFLVFGVFVFFLAFAALLYKYVPQIKTPVDTWITQTRAELLI